MSKSNFIAIKDIRLDFLKLFQYQQNYVILRHNMKLIRSELFYCFYVHLSIFRVYYHNLGSQWVQVPWTYIYCSDYIRCTMFCNIVRCLFIHLAKSGCTILRTNKEIILDPDGHITIVVYLISSLSHSLSASEIH